ncbi:hypothetical protein [Spirosoma flavus]
MPAHITRFGYVAQLDEKIGRLSKEESIEEGIGAVGQNSQDNESQT